MGQVVRLARTGFVTVGKKCFIYGLKDPRTGCVRYIGRTHNLKARLYHHMRSKDQTHRSNWIQLLLSLGLKPIIFEIEIVDICNYSIAEKKWIIHYRSQGASLVNCSDGGEGSVLGNKTTFLKGHDMTPEVRRKISESTRGRPGTVTFTDEVRERMAAAKRGKRRGSTPDHVKEKIRAAQIGKKRKPLSEVHRKLLSKIRRGRPWSEGRRAAYERSLVI